MGAHPCNWNGAKTVSQCDTWCATGKSIRPCCAARFEVGWGVGVQGLGWGRSGRVVLIDNGRVYQSKAADALVQVKTTIFGTNVGLNMLLNISSRYFGGLFWSRQLGLPSSDGYFFRIIKIRVPLPSHLCNGNPYTGQVASLYWIIPQVMCYHSPDIIPLICNIISASLCNH